MEAHLLINLLEDPAPSFPFLTLLISGGHCLLINSQSLGSYQIIGQTLDDAVGEAFDKVAKLLGLPYPGGPHIEKIALNGNPKAYDFPRPMIHSDNLDMSLSGLKTAVLYTIQKIEDLNEDIKADIAASFQKAVTDVLIAKIKKTVEQTNHSDVIVAGGVAANGVAIRMAVLSRFLSS